MEHGTGKQVQSSCQWLGKMVAKKTRLPSLKEELEGITETLGELKAIMDTLTRCIIVLASSGREIGEGIG